MKSWPAAPILASLILVPSALVPSRAAAEPAIRVDPGDAHDCNVLRSFVVTGLPPSADVSVNFVIDGAERSGHSGRASASGDFASPIANFLLPCSLGGEVTARVSLDGQVLATTNFTVLPFATGPFATLTHL